jgi:hypothetical protein
MYAHVMVYISFRICTNNHKKKKKIEQEIHNDKSQILIGDNNNFLDKDVIAVEIFALESSNFLFDGGYQPSRLIKCF